MHFSHALVAALAAVPSFASPVAKRQVANDFDILNYALTLEFLERKFYQECLAKFDEKAFNAAGFDHSFYKNLKEIARDEEVHVDFLVKGITAAGGTPVNEATYAFPFTEDPSSCVTLASVLEGVGVSAYLGAAASIMEKSYLTAAGSILSVEARHSSYIRASLDQSPFPQPFDTPLTFNQVFSLAAGFITGFAPQDPPLPFTAFPALTLGCSEEYYVAGESGVVFSGAAEQYAQPEGQQVFAAFFSGLEPAIVPVTTSGADFMIEKIPEGVRGQVYVVLTKDEKKATDDTILAGPAILEVYSCGHVPEASLPKCA